TTSRVTAPNIPPFADKEPCGCTPFVGLWGANDRLGDKAYIRLRPGAGPFMMRCSGRARTFGGTMTKSGYLATQMAVGVLLATAAQAETHTFVPTQFYNTFSFAHPPALHIKSGDRVLTKTIDAEGVDWNGKQVAPRANPETGPFYVDGAKPGEVLDATLNKLETNRAMAFSGSLLSPYTTDP